MVPGQGIPIYMTKEYNCCVPKTPAQIEEFWVHLVRGRIIHLSYIHTAQLLETSLTLPERDIAAVSPDKGGVWFKMFAALRKSSSTSSNDK